MADISLTASMRSNLLSLQNTTKMMDKTQERLSTGKKVNSALDNPGSYYSARSLENRAGDLSTLLDSMGQGISTVKAANEGIESITSFVEQAKAVANSAREQSAGEVTSSGTLNATPEQKTYTFTLDGNSYSVASSKTGDDLATQIQTAIRNDASHAVTTATATFDSDTGKINISDGATPTAHTAQIDGYAFKLQAPGGNAVYGGLADPSSLSNIVTAITSAMASVLDAEGNAVQGVTAAVSADGNSIVMTSQNGTEVNISGNINGISLNGSAGSDSRVSYMKQFNDLFDQITDLAKDSGYKGTNLLQKDNLTVMFNENGESKLVIEGDDASAAGLGLHKATSWGTNAAIDTALTEINSAISSLRTMASKFGNNYSILQTREEFTEKLVNVLEEGADKLTLADMNEESANMLALQTRQQLAVNSLSLASQAAQSILKLFS